ncbi:MAG: hypothetical protein AAF993_11800 [Pseudomonadota bacterium]
MKYKLIGLLLLVSAATYAATALVGCKSCVTLEDYVKSGAAKVIQQQGGTSVMLGNILTNIVFGDYRVDDAIVQDENGVRKVIIEFEPALETHMLGVIYEQDAIMVRATDMQGRQITGLVRYGQTLLTNLARMWADKDAAWTAVRNQGGDAENPPSAPAPTDAQLQGILRDLYSNPIYHNYAPTLRAYSNLQGLSWLTELNTSLRCHPECR